MDLNQFFDQQERELFQAALDGDAICQDTSWYTEYLFKFQGTYYSYIDQEENIGELKIYDQQGGRGLICCILDFYHIGAIKKAPIDKCVEKGMITVFMVRSVYFKDDDEYYVWYDTVRNGKCHKIDTEKLLTFIMEEYISDEAIRFSIEPPSQEELIQVQECE